MESSNTNQTVQLLQKISVNVEKEKAELQRLNIKDHERERMIIQEFEKNRDYRKGIHDLALYVCDRYNIFTRKDSMEIYIYDKGVYTGKGDRFINQEIQRILGKHVTNNIVNEVLGHIKRKTLRDKEDLKEPLNKICLQNGILDLETLKIEAHSPEIIFFNRLPVAYKPEAECPSISRFLSEVLPSSTMNLAQELAGYCLYKEYIIHKCFMLTGSGANGKSVFINLIRSFLGNENCCSISLQELEDDKFSRIYLYGKLANTYADLSSKALQSTSFFKLLTGQDLIGGEYKFQSRMHFVNYAKMIFSANQIPKSPDNSDAFFRRWIICHFPNQFLNQAADKNLIKKLTTPEELSGFLNWAIIGLKRLLDQGDFSDTRGIDMVREDYIRRSDSVAAFIMDKIIISGERYVFKKKLFEAYADYCREMNYPMDCESTFHKNLIEHIRVSDYQPSIKDQDGKTIRPHAWKGIDLKDEAIGENK